MVKLLWRRPRQNGKGEADGYDVVDAAKDGVQRGDLLYVTVGSEAIRGHATAAATVFANAIGCDAAVVVDVDIDRASQVANGEQCGEPSASENAGDDD